MGMVITDACRFVQTKLSAIEEVIAEECCLGVAVGLLEMVERIED